MKISSPIASILIVGASLMGSAAGQASEPIITASAQSLNWETTPEGVAFASLVGDRFNEAYMAMVKLPGGLVSPPHTKSANMFGVMVSGAMIHEAVGESSNIVLRTGSFYKIPRDVPHVSKCVSNEECVTFLYQDGKFDFLPVAGAASQ
ncbi:MAG: DUF4437 domain-containing protein [Rhizobiaceae bacterium]